MLDSYAIIAEAESLAGIAYGDPAAARFPRSAISSIKSSFGSITF
jgi:hypothetical protein